MGKILINYCSYEELMTIPGIGEDFAFGILTLRKKYDGQFTPQRFAIFKGRLDHTLVDEVMQYFDFTPCLSNSPKTSSDQNTHNDPSTSLYQDHSSSSKGHSRSSQSDDYPSSYSSHKSSRQSPSYSQSHYDSYSNDSDDSHSRSPSHGRSHSRHHSTNHSSRSQGHSSRSSRNCQSNGSESAPRSERADHYLNHRSSHRFSEDEHSKSFPSPTRYDRSCSPSYSRSHSPDYKYHFKSGSLHQARNYQNDSTSDSAPHSERANHYSDCRSYKTSNHALGSSRHAKKYHGDGSDSAPHSERANHYSDHTSFESSNKLEKQFTDLENSVDSKFCKFEEQVSSLEGNVQNLHKQNPILEKEAFLKLENQVTHLETKIDLISSRFDSVQDSVGEKLKSILHVVETLQNSVNDVALSVQVLLTQPPCSSDKSVQTEIEPNCPEGVVESSISIVSDVGCDQGSVTLSPPIHPKIGQGSITPDTDISTLNQAPTPITTRDDNSNNILSSDCVPTEAQAIEGRPTDQSMSSSSEEDTRSRVPPIPPVLPSSQVRAAMGANQPMTSPSSAGSRSGLMLKESRMDEQVLEGESDPPIPSDLMYPWRLPPWPPPGDGQTPPDRTLFSSAEEMVGTSPMPSSVPASSSVRDRVDAVQPNASLSSKGSRSGLSMKEMRMGVQVPGEGKSNPGNPLVPSPLTRPWCLPPWPPPV